MFRVLLVLSLTVWSTLCNAQQGQPSYTDYASQISNNQQQDLDLKPPLLYQYYTLESIDRRKPFVDTSFSNGFHNYDPIRLNNNIYANLGNNGSASYSFVYQKAIPRRVDFGMHQFDPYKYELEDLKFFVVNRPVSNLFFSNQGARQNFFVAADFSRPFSDGTQMSLEYRRISQDGSYTAQNIKHTNLGLSFQFQSKSKRYQLLTTLINNVETSNNNGGINNIDDLSNGQLISRLNVPVNLVNAATRHQERAVHLIQFLNLNSAKAGFKLRAKHHLEVGGGYFQYYDDDVSSLVDDAFYGNFDIDSRGIRFDTEFSRLSNSFTLQGSKSSGLNLEVGLSHDWTSIEEHPMQTSLNDFFLTFKGAIPYKGQVLQTKAWWGFGDANSTFDLEGSLSIQLSDWLEASGVVNLYRHRVDRVSDQLFVSETLIWDNNFDKPFGTLVAGSLMIPKFNLSIGLRQNLESNTVFYNTLAEANQYSDVFSATTLDVNHSLTFWKFGLDNYAAFQVFNENLFHLPSFVSRHNLYWEGFLFGRNMLGRLGVETTLVPTHDSNAYMPLIGRFYQSETSSMFYPNTDLYFLAKVSDFRAFFKFENFSDYFSNDIPFYVVNHPQNDVRFRFGIRWILKD